jgi:hypothetical protein
VTPALAIFGNLTIDDLVFPDGSTRWAVPGGNAMYAAFGASLWTEQISIVAPLGPDYPLELAQGRFDLSRCTHVPRSLRDWGLYEEDGSRHFIFRNATRDWESFCPSPESAASGKQIAAHVAPMPRQVALGLIHELRKAGTRFISVDLDERDIHHSPSPAFPASMGKTGCPRSGFSDLGKQDIHPTQFPSGPMESAAEQLRSSDLFLPSRQETLCMFPGSQPLEALLRLRELAPDVALIAVKCGADGVIGHAQGSPDFIRVPAVPIELVDATGAGDSFCGGVLAGFTKTNDAVEALLSGVVSASFCAQGWGLDGLAAARKEQALARAAAARNRVTLHPT